MAETFECNNIANSQPNHCSQALSESVHSKPPLKRAQAGGDDGGATGNPLVNDLVYRYTLTDREVAQVEWEPKHKTWEHQTADLIKKHPKQFSQFDEARNLSNIADAAFDLGSKILFDDFINGVNKDLKGQYKLSLSPDQEMLAKATEKARAFGDETPDFAGHLDLRDKHGKVIGSVQIVHNPIPGSQVWL